MSVLGQRKHKHSRWLIITLAMDKISPIPSIATIKKTTTKVLSIKTDNVAN